MDYLDESCSNGSMPDSEKCLVHPSELSRSENTDPLGTYYLIYVPSVWFFINGIWRHVTGYSTCNWLFNRRV